MLEIGVIAHGLAEQPVRGDEGARWEGATPEHYQHNAVSLRLEVEQGEIYNIHWGTAM